MAGLFTSTAKSMLEGTKKRRRRDDWETRDGATQKAHGNLTTYQAEGMVQQYVSSANGDPATKAQGEANAVCSDVERNIRLELDLPVYN
ncbi:hypothetical protein BG011_001381 [Mortierella polycephala]|uniref:Uncharacterized protein n=1 Tax=Mortierella polycephala TaxID=41804 RepID=A0A9P6Q5G1_9FUNG|nr:hypothetical protein BG011_001381 [Mortierella polycephala]